MGRHIENTQCPRCAEKGRDKSMNNLGVYEDGSAYCWSCGYYVPQSIPILSGRMGHGNKGNRTGTDMETTGSNSSVVLPSDCDSYIPAVARLWLAKYHFRETDIINNRLLWSEYYQQLIFPYFDKYNNLVAWQGRQFGENRQGRDKKWFSQGDLKTLYHIIPPQKEYDSIVLVEDIVSAIRVGHVQGSMPLFGNNVLNRLSTLRRLVGSIVIWLDPDMRIKVVKAAEVARQMGFQIRTIFSEFDPKEYTNEQIVEILK